MRIAEHEAGLRKRLAEAKVDNPALCARLLTAHAARLDRIAYLLARDQELAPDRALYLDHLASRRAAGEPLAYILGRKEFYSREFLVNNSTLTPRPETEMIIDSALRLCDQESLAFADLGCGSGCIGLTLMRERPTWRAALMDNQPQTLATARQNAHLLHCRPAFILGDIFNPPFSNGIFDLIVSNPPYISPAEKEHVMGETLAYEPHCALFSPENGLAHLKAVLALAANALKPGGWVIVEHGANQGDCVRNFMNELSFVHIEDREDLAGLPRCALGQKKE